MTPRGNIHKGLEGRAGGKTLNVWLEETQAWSVGWEEQIYDAWKIWPLRENGMEGKVQN